MGKYILILIVSGCLFIGMFTLTLSLTTSAVYEWDTENSYTVVYIEPHLTPIGTPYLYVHQGMFIMEVNVTTKTGKSEKWFMRQNLFENDFEQLSKENTIDTK